MVRSRRDSGMGGLIVKVAGLDGPQPLRIRGGAGRDWALTTSGALAPSRVSLCRGRCARTMARLGRSQRDAISIRKPRSAQIPGIERLSGEPLLIRHASPAFPRRSCRGRGLVFRRVQRLRRIHPTRDFGPEFRRACPCQRRADSSHRMDPKRTATLRRDPETAEAVI